MILVLGGAGYPRALTVGPLVPCLPDGVIGTLRQPVIPFDVNEQRSPLLLLREGSAPIHRAPPIDDRIEGGGPPRLHAILPGPERSEPVAEVTPFPPVGKPQAPDGVSNRRGSGFAVQVVGEHQQARRAHRLVGSEDHIVQPVT